MCSDGLTVTVVCKSTGNGLRESIGDQSLFYSYLFFASRWTAPLFIIFIFQFTKICSNIQQIQALPLPRLGIRVLMIDEIRHWLYWQTKTLLFSFCTFATVCSAQLVNFPITSAWLKYSEQYRCSLRQRGRWQSMIDEISLLFHQLNKSIFNKKAILVYYF